MIEDGDCEDDLWIECWQCAGIGATPGCFEDCCSGAGCDPEDSEYCCCPSRCDVCAGKGGWHPANAIVAGDPTEPRPD